MGKHGNQHNRFSVHLVSLDPTQGSEIQKTRPCLIISPDEMNTHLQTVIVAPMTTGGKVYPTRISCLFDGKSGFIALDQIRTVDKTRLIKRLGEIEKSLQTTVLETLQEMFVL